MKRKRRKNGAIKFVAFSFTMLLFSMMFYISYYAITHKQEMLNNSYNSHQAMLAKQNIRGTIYSREGDILAETITDDSGKEKRVYPFGEVFSHVVGYSTKGKAGIELNYNYYLINSNCSLAKKVDNEASGLKIPGDNVYSTLDLNLQQVAYDTLGAYNGAIIATDPKTGEILAMVSKPGFDPNRIEQDWNALVSNKESSVLLNRVSQGLYPPGSTFKIVTALEYLRENQSAVNTYQFNCNGSITADGMKINCYHGSVHGTVDFATSFAKSCNSSFANMGMNLNRKEFRQTLDDLMFGKDLPVDFAYNKSSIQVDEETSIADLMQASIGQGKDAISPLHLNMITCAIANQGLLMKPYLVSKVENDDGGIVKQFNPVESKNLLSKNEADALTTLMRGVVEGGTAKKLSGLSYSAAGKTGSAEFNGDKGESHAWFTGFAPVEDPQICVTVIIEGAGSGGDYAVPLARRLFDSWLVR